MKKLTRAQKVLRAFAKLLDSEINSDCKPEAMCRFLPNMDLQIVAAEREFDCLAITLQDEHGRKKKYKFRLVE